MIDVYVGVIAYMYMCICLRNRELVYRDLEEEDDVIDTPFFHLGILNFCISLNVSSHVLLE